MANVNDPRVPVIFDTDIGDDIDDTWALVMLLKSPQLDLKLVTTTCGKSEYRSKIMARILTIAGRTDVQIGMGEGGREGVGGQAQWVEGYDLKSYTGKVHEDGVQAVIDLVSASPQPVTIICIGPPNTLAEALRRKPGIASNVRFVGMFGSVRKGYKGGAVEAEYNVKAIIPAAKTVLHAPWKEIVITPLDTCGLIDLSGERFQTLCRSDDKLVKALLENYRFWAKNDKVAASSVLFDTVAVYLAYPGPKPLLKIEQLAIRVDDEGFTRIDPAGAKMDVATAWKDIDGFRDLLVKILTK